jgi:C-terminal processing protease CtpA/Prc
VRRESRTQATVVATALFVGGLACGAVVGRAAVARAQDPFLQIDLLARVITTVEHDYVDEVPRDVLVDAAIEGMLAALDDQSRWLDADQLRSLREDADGAALGLVPEDVPTKVAPSGRELVEAELLPPGVVVVRLAQFPGGTAGRLHEAVDEAASPIGGIPSLRGLVLDLRDNPGGLLSEAVAVSDLFLDEGPIVRTAGRRPGDDEVYTATPGGFPPGLPVAVITNAMSASASEIVVAALQDTHRGTIVGERTYGKGSVQQVYLHTNSRGSALKLTVGRYFTPSGAPVASHQGRAPDVEIAPALTPCEGEIGLRWECDPQLRAAVATLP